MSVTSKFQRVFSSPRGGGEYPIRMTEVDPGHLYELRLDGDPAVRISRNDAAALARLLVEVLAAPCLPQPECCR